MAGLLPLGKQTFTDANGIPLAGGSVAFYVPSTTTFKQTWQDAAASIFNTNPVTLDSAGQAVIYGNGTYRQVVKDALGNTIWDQNTANPASILPDPTPATGMYITRVNSAGTGYENIDPSTVIPASTQINPNIVDNATFRVNQRLVTGTVTLTANAYGHDRWKAGASGCSYTFAGVGPNFTVTVISGSLLQAIEGSNVQDSTYTVSHAGTAQCRLYQSSPGTYAPSPRTTTGVTGGSNLMVEFSTGTISKVKVEVGTGATAYQPRPFVDDLLAAQRFFYAGSIPSMQFYGPANPGVMIIPWSLPVPMRIIPTVQAVTSGSTINASLSTTATPANQEIDFQFTMTQGTPSLWSSNGGTFRVSAEI